MSKKIVSEIANREAFFHLLGHNPGLIVLKLGATWCGPCQQIKNVVHGFFASSPEEVICCDIDVDESFDMYALLKSKKMVNGIPVLLCYKKVILHLFLMIWLLVLTRLSYTNFSKDVETI